MLASCSALLSWDEQTYLPRVGAAYRGDQMALLAGLHHERATDPTLADLLAAVEGSDLLGDPGSPEAANVRQWRRSFDRLSRMPWALVEELARATTLAQGIWVEARRADDFEAFRPSLETVVALKRQEGEALADPGGDPYDALLDEYEPGAKTGPTSTSGASTPRSPEATSPHSSTGFGPRSTTKAGATPPRP